jgi:hypothetical protein
MTLVESIQLRRADEQMATSWRVITTAEVRAESTRTDRTCAIPGCWTEIPIGDRPQVCSACRGKGLGLAPCLGCGGQLRRADQTSPAKDRRGYCSWCRADMTRRPGGWPKGQSGNPSGRMR